MMEDSADPGGQILPVDAKTSIKAITDNSQAGGGVPNIVQASLDNMGDTVEDIFFTFEITQGSAVFTQGGKQTVTVHANPSYVANASFTDQIAEKGTIRVFPTVSPKLTAETGYNFAPAAEKYSLNLAVISDNAVADGKTANTAVATLKKSNNDPVPGQLLRFDLPQGGAATFTNGSRSTTLATDTKGQASVSVVLKSEQATTVTLTCILVSDATIQQMAKLNFQALAVPVSQTFLTLEKITDNQPSDGKSANQLRARVTDENGQGLGNQSVIFSLGASSSDAEFVGYSHSPITVPTNNSGTTSIIGVIDRSDRDESVNVIGTLASEPGMTRNQDLHFTAVIKPPPPPPPPSWPLKIIAISVNQAALRRTFPQASNYFWCQIQRTADSPNSFPSYRVEIVRYPTNGALQIPNKGFNNNFMIVQSREAIFLGIKNNIVGKGPLGIDVYDGNRSVHLWRGNIDPYSLTSIPKYN